MKHARRFPKSDKRREARLRRKLSSVTYQLDRERTRHDINYRRKEYYKQLATSTKAQLELKEQAIATLQRELAEANRSLARVRKFVDTLYTECIKESP